MDDDNRQAASLIRVMPEGLANKIAAGEVVERPASVAKELIENALDAGAEEVKLVVKDAGRTLVQVIDDGCGMSRADAERCFRRHATSKIQSLDDLTRVRTLGFRGEALASIGAVAQVELKTRRTEDTAGTRVHIDGGTQEAIQPCAAPNGTSVAVRNLFYNVPARRNFLKTPATEFKHLVDTFRYLALAEPRTAFTLVHNDNEIERLTAARSGGFYEALRHRIGELFGADCTEALAPLDDSTSYVAARGFVGAPERHRRGRDEQFLFVNGRHVESRYLAHAVRAAYGDLLPDGTFPFFALFLELDPRRVDVNVHPTKAEVKFEDRSGVYGFLRSAVREALGTASLTPQLDDEDEKQTAFPSEGHAKPISVPSDEARPPAAPPTPGGDGSARDRDRANRDPSASLAALYAPPGAPAAAAEDEEATEGQDDASPREGPGAVGDMVLRQLQERYIVVVRAEGVLVIDQQAAHRRICYERALGRMERAEGGTQQLLFPHTVDFSADDYALAKELLPDLRALGFDLEPFGGRSIVVRGVPPELRVGEERAGLESLLQQYKDHRDRLRLDTRENLARSLAVRSAVRVGQRLQPEEMRALAEALFQCEMPYADAQGRPTTLQLSPDDLDERFGR